MTVQLMRAPKENQKDIDDSPVHIDGTRYRWMMTYSEGHMNAFSDTITELIGVIIPGYMEIPFEDTTTATASRTVAASLNFRPMIQARLFLDAITAGHPPTAEEKAVAFAENEPDNNPRATVWEATMPLVLVDVWYQNTGGTIPNPVSYSHNPDGPPNIEYIECLDELSYLKSLHHLGMIQLAELEA